MDTSSLVNISKLWHYIYIAPAWTLSVEMMFYCIAPFIARKKISFIFILCIISIACKLIIDYFGHQDESIKSRFFLGNFYLFFIGLISYKLSKFNLYQNIKITFLCVLYFIFINYIFLSYL